jgi:hypothetical protein
MESALSGPSEIGSGIKFSIDSVLLIGLDFTFGFRGMDHSRMRASRWIYRGWIRFYRLMVSLLAREQRVMGPREKGEGGLCGSSVGLISGRVSDSIVPVDVGS